MLKRELEEIEKDFEKVLKGQKSDLEKNNEFLKLMNELEQDYKSFIFEPTKEELTRNDVVLYQKISKSRTF